MNRQKKKEKKTMTNKKIGNTTERKIAELMHKEGWWVHLVKDKMNGQPFDLIMSKHNVTWFMDVKHVKAGQDYFPTSRIEENQRNAMKLLESCGTDKTGFIIYFEDDGWFMIQNQNVKYESNRINKDEMKRLVFMNFR
jgi:Holliday junction resolvase